jgi:RNA polymerase sigma factor (sigma-70 family)
MANRLMSKFVRHLRRAVLLRDGAGLTDGQLLGSFIDHRDEPAFAALVHRHGPMVWRVCRRVLGNHHDAEDAFQATFLVLVHKASTVRPRENVANWLYGVAYRTSLKARTLATKRRMRERQLKEMPVFKVQDELWRDLHLVLDQELNRLPDKYRLAILLCDLEGKTYKEAARQFGCPEGTFAARLARARAMLAKRLRRHGLAVSAGALGTAFSQSGASDSVAALLMSSTLRAASLGAAGQTTAACGVSVRVAALTKGVLHTMFLSKLKSASFILLAMGLVLGAGGYGTGLLNYPSAVASEGKKDGPRKVSANETGKPKTNQELAEPPPNLEDLREREVELKQQLQQLQTKAAQLEREALLRLDEPNQQVGFPANRFRYRIPVEIGSTESKAGGRIEIQEVRGTRPRIEVGGLYVIRGKYVLPPGERGKLYFLERTDGDWAGHVEISPQGRLIVKGGLAALDLQSIALDEERGEFALLHGMEGPGYFNLHLTAAGRYSRTFARVFFGSGDNVWRKKP